SALPRLRPIGVGAGRHDDVEEQARCGCGQNGLAQDAQSEGLSAEPPTALTTPEKPAKGRFKAAGSKRRVQGARFPRHDDEKACPRLDLGYPSVAPTKIKVIPAPGDEPVRGW